MPELPEVEVIRSGLSELIAKKTIEKVNVLNAKSFQASTSSIDVFVNNSTILSVKRPAKFFDLFWLSRKSNCPVIFK